MKRKKVNRELADKSIRLRIANRYMYLGGLFVGIFSLIMMWLDPGMFAKNSRILLYLQMGLIASFVCYGFFFNYANTKHPTAARRGQIYIQLGIYIVANLGCENIAVSILIYGLAIIAIMYEHVLMIDCCVYTLFALGMIKIIFLWNRAGIETVEVRSDYIAQIMMLGLMTFAVERITRLNDDFNKAARAVIYDEKEEQKDILEEVLKIAEVVQGKSEDVGKMLSMLQESSEIVSSSIDEIQCGNQNTCESVENQTQMTQEISKSIDLAAAQTNEMADAFEVVEEEARHGTELMRVLDEHSKVINEKSLSAVEAMQSLSQRTTDMEKFTEEILQISSQTNLLALNASIEAARAGEAGKGFAVVADEIRELSDATKQTTEEISELIRELNNEAQYVSKAIEVSGNAVTEQSHAITEAGKAFFNVEKSIKNLNGRITELRKNASELLVSNNAITDSISQLSAVTQQVTASSEEVSRIAEENKKNAQDANGRLSEVVEISHRLDKYDTSGQSKDE